MIVGLNWIANHALRLFGVEPKDEVASAFTAQEVQSIVERSQAEGLLEDEQGLLAGALEFSDRTAQDVMIRDRRAGDGRTRAARPDDVERLVARTGFSRFPVVDDGRDAHRLPAPQGRPLRRRRTTRYRARCRAWRVRALAVVGPHDEVEDALAAMQRSGSHLARVDEDGRAVGVVFLEDILEELVGEVRDAMQRGQMS